MFDFLKKKSKDPVELCFTTDIHCHIVPGVDDGSPDAATSADLIERMQSWGIKRIIASPHVTQTTFENDASTIDPAMEKLHAELQRRGNDIEVSHSAEYRIDELFSRRLEAGDIWYLPNNHLLIENAFLQEPWNLDQLIFDLQVKGIRPILAHPERYVLLAPPRPLQIAPCKRTAVPDQSSQPRRRIRKDREKDSRAPDSQRARRLHRHRPA